MLAASPPGTPSPLRVLSRVCDVWASIPYLRTCVDACALVAARLKVGPWQVLTGLLRVGQEMGLVPLIKPFQSIWARFSFRNSDIMWPTSSALIFMHLCFSCCSVQLQRTLIAWHLHTFLHSHIHDCFSQQVDESLICLSILISWLLYNWSTGELALALC